ncbi:hypothetical protein KFU94_46470 [Chloroflexi bacterium TSY]|nr:hypothetical protein [Chloroflexi bacterium TSY]
MKVMQLIRIGLYLAFVLTGCVGVSLPVATPLPRQEGTVPEQKPSDAQEMGVPLRHRYVEFEDDAGVTWQGELLRYSEESVQIIQPIQSGGMVAVRLAAPEFIDDPTHLSTTVEPAIESVNTNPPDVEILFVRARQSANDTWSFDVTLNHPDTGWEDYTDGWHVETPEGEILGTRILFHPHVNEMPFTRSLGNMTLPEDVTEIRIRAHDLISGYAPQTVTVPLDRSGEGERYLVERE